jgi:hypothetical protein
MEQAANQAVTEDCRRALQTYLRDHVAGAQHAIQLLQALCELQAGTPAGQSTSELLKQVQEDLVVLKRVATSVGAEDFQLKEIAGWLGDKLGRLKLAVGRPLYSEVSECDVDDVAVDLTLGQ